ncbi:MAG: DUF2191 domain-containing protein [Myxococcota bacterium]
MRTTLTVDDTVMRELRELAHRSGVPLKQVVNQALVRGLDALREPAEAEPYETPTYSMGEARVPNLDKALALAATLEDEEIARKLTARK